VDWLVDRFAGRQCTRKDEIRIKLFLTLYHIRLTMYDMKNSSLTIRLDKDLDALLAKASRRSEKNRSVIAREALRRQLRLEQFEAIRKRVMPFAEVRGYLTDEDIFSQIS